MDIFLLNAAYNRFGIVDEFESFYWTERYSDYGEFKIILPPTERMREVLLPGKYLMHSETDQIMVIDEVLVAKNEEDVQTMTVTGRGMVSILENRAVTFYNANSTGLSKAITDTPGQVVAKMVAKVCMHGLGLSPDDIIPDLYTADTSGTTHVITAALKTQSLYTAAKEICDSEGMGFRLQLLAQSPRLRFNIYSGEVLPNVVFSSALDNLTSESYLKSDKNYKNMAYVVAKDDIRIEVVPAPGISIYAEGLKRRVLVVDGTDIDPAELTWDDFRGQLKQRGLEALAATKRVNIFDGELTPNNPFKYRRDYNLGDIVFLMDEYGVKKAVTVTEYIWGYDAEGYKSYPSFTDVEI